jgi:hypothetical protein
MIAVAVTIMIAAMEADAPTRAAADSPTLVARDCWESPAGRRRADEPAADEPVADESPAVNVARFRRRG